ncbi:MAG: hypothetical protein PHW87_07870 [Methanothrix sp.]|nr:hypothetical protein [Methanothrix sp.]
MPEDLFEQKRGLLLKIMAYVGSIQGRTRLQKMVFLAQEELGLPHLFDFKKHYYGPYSWDLTETVERMLSRGEIEEKVESLGDSIRYTYSASSDAETIEALHAPEISEKALDTLKKLSEIPLTALLNYVYRKYLPERCKAL